MYIEVGWLIAISAIVIAVIFSLYRSLSKTQDDLISSRRDNEKLNNEINAEKVKIAALNTDINDKNDVIAYLRIRIEEKEKELEKHCEIELEQKKQIAKLTKRVADAEAYYHRKEAETADLRSEIEKLKKDLAFYTNIKEASADMNDAADDGELTYADLDEEQKAAFDRMANTRENLFITGKAGTGKSTLLKVFAKACNRCLLKLAPTGISAMNIGGVTIHSAFGFDNISKLNIDEISLSNLKLNSDKHRVLSNSSIIIIDEISMVRADVLEKIDYILQTITEDRAPFGGIQMILFGDIFQLPPIAKYQERLYLKDEFGGMHFFNSHAYKNGNFGFIELTVNHRQNGDDTYFDILNKIREGTFTDSDLDILNTRAEFDTHDMHTVTRLFSKKDEAENFNQTKLSESIGQEAIFKARITYPENGVFPNGQNIKFETCFPIAETLKLKKGSLVMFVKNNHDKWANGTIGLVSDIGENYIRVSANGEEHDVGVSEFEQLEAKYENGRIEYHTVCKVAQFPIVLAYAMTIHKSQGQTYGKVACDVSQCFAPGQAYVALSRVKSLNGLFLMNKIERSQIKIDRAVNDFYNYNRQNAKQLNNFPNFYQNH